MSEWTQVTSQVEFDAAIKAGNYQIELTKAITVDIRVPDGIVAIVKAVAGAWFRARESSHVVARESSHVVARESSHVVAWGSSHVVARESSHVVARESSHVEAWGSSHVVARESSHVVARESSHVVARESSHVVARESSHVVAWGSSHVVARESSHVEAWGSSHVEAWGAASLSLFGGLVKASASAQVTTQLHRNAKCDGGVQAVIKLPTTAQEWCDYYGAPIEGTNAILFKGVNDDFMSPHSSNTIYKPGAETIAADWDGGKRECGLGLHFSPHPSMTKEFNRTASKFVACLVPLEDISVHPNGDYPQKVKAERCWNYYECDSMGKILGAKFEKPAVAKVGAKRKAKPTKKTAKKKSAKK